MVSKNAIEPKWKWAIVIRTYTEFRRFISISNSMHPNYSNLTLLPKGLVSEQIVCDRCGRIFACALFVCDQGDNWYEITEKTSRQQTNAKKNKIKSPNDSDYFFGTYRFCLVFFVFILDFSVFSRWFQVFIKFLFGDFVPINPWALTYIWLMWTFYTIEVEYSQLLLWYNIMYKKLCVFHWIWNEIVA